MTRRARSLAAVAVILVLGATVAAAQALTPPAGTPDLSQMTLQSADLGPAAGVSSAYVKPPSKIVAQYDRNFTLTSTSAGVALDAIDTEILLAHTSAYAKSFFKELRTLYGSKFGHNLLAADIEKAAGPGRLTRKQIRFGTLRAIDVGDQSLLITITVRTRTRRLVEDVVALRVGGVVANLSIVAAAPKLAASVPTALATTVAGHVTSVLASGATGPTGPSGSTGATGAS